MLYFIFSFNILLTLLFPLSLICAETLESYLPHSPKRSKAHLGICAETRWLKKSNYHRLEWAQTADTHRGFFINSAWFHSEAVKLPPSFALDQYFFSITAALCTNLELSWNQATIYFCVALNVAQCFSTLLRWGTYLRPKNVAPHHTTKGKKKLLNQTSYLCYLCHFVEEQSIALLPLHIAGIDKWAKNQFRSFAYFCPVIGW